MTMSQPKLPRNSYNKFKEMTENLGKNTLESSIDICNRLEHKFHFKMNIIYEKLR